MTNRRRPAEWGGFGLDYVSTYRVSSCEEAFQSDKEKLKEDKERIVQDGVNGRKKFLTAMLKHFSDRLYLLPLK
jgi:hypothetical protein